MSQVRVGVIGLGFIGKIHLEKLAENPSAKILGISDIDENQIEIAKDLLSKIGIRNEIKSSINFEEILDEVDAVFIASPAKTHYEILKKVIEKGKHAFVEKPLCTRYDQAEEIKYIAEKKGVVVQVGHVERFNEAYTFAKQFVKLPGYIRAERLSLFPGRNLDTDVIFDIMIHDIDAVVGLVEDIKINSIESLGIPVITDKPDIAMARIKFSKGCIAELTASRVAYRRFRKMRVFQIGSYISIDFLEKKTEIYMREKENGKYNVRAIIKQFENSDPMKKEVDSFISAILKENMNNSLLDEAIKSVFLAEKIKESLFFMPENSIG